MGIERRDLERGRTSEFEEITAIATLDRMDE